MFLITNDQEQQDQQLEYIQYQRQNILNTDSVNENAFYYFANIDFCNLRAQTLASKLVNSQNIGIIITGTQNTLSSIQNFVDYTISVEKIDQIVIKPVSIYQECQYHCQQLSDQIYCSPRLQAYIFQIQQQFKFYNISYRDNSINKVDVDCNIVEQLAKIIASSKNQTFVIPEDIKTAFLICSCNKMRYRLQCKDMQYNIKQIPISDAQKQVQLIIDSVDMI